MSLKTDNTNLERLIAEVRAADEAGVFSRSRVNLATLVEGPAPSLVVRFYERALVGLPLAACLAIVIGIASMRGGPMDGSISVSPSPLAVLSETENRDIGNRDIGNRDIGGELCSAEVITRCVAGPGSPMAAECGCADLDRDGDVDLRDWSSYQRMVPRVR